MVLETLESITHKSLNKEKSNNLIPKVDEKIGDVFEWNFDFIPSVVHLPFALSFKTLKTIGLTIENIVLVLFGAI